MTMACLPHWGSQEGGGQIFANEVGNVSLRAWLEKNNFAGTCPQISEIQTFHTFPNVER